MEGGVSAEVVAVDLEGDVPGRVWQLAFSSAEEDGLVLVTILFEWDLQVFVFEMEGWCGESYVPCYEYRLGVAVTEGLEQLVGVEEIE